MNIAQLIKHMTARLEQAGLDASNGLGQGTLTAFDEAAWLVLWQLGLPLDNLDSVEKQPVAPSDIEKVAMLFDKRIKQRIPAAYLTQEAWLQGVPFYVDERVIIPRSFIAELLFDGSLEPWLSASTQRVLDLCTGNGSLAVLAAMVYPDVAVDAADISLDALAVARINIDKHQLQERITLIESDGLASCPGPYDLIICNPPYVNSASMAALPAEFQAEPALALAGGVDGMDFVRPMLRQVAQHLNAQGVLVLEIGHEHEHFEQAFARLQPCWLNTSAGNEQVLLLTREQLI